MATWRTKAPPRSSRRRRPEKLSPTAYWVAHPPLSRRRSRHSIRRHCCVAAATGNGGSLRQHTPLDDRDNFNEVVLTYDDRSARAEASRCLDCDVYCSLCVGVCPNFALQTYQTEPFDMCLPELRLDGDDIAVTPGRTPPCGTSISDRRADRFLQRVWQLHDLLPHSGSAVPRQTSTVSRPPGI